MLDSVRIYGEAISAEEERFTFFASCNDKITPCSISRTAVIELAKGSKDDLLNIFDRNRERISEATRIYLVIYPDHSPVMLGSNNF